jgi:hypothetical protein
VSGLSSGQGMMQAGVSSLPGSSAPLSATDPQWSSADMARLLGGLLHAYQQEVSSLVALWQQADALFVQRFDALLSMGAGLRTKAPLSHALTSDLVFAL